MVFAIYSDMPTFKVKVRYTFDGWFEIAADSEHRAREIAEQDCGLVIGGDIHTSNPMHVNGWDFDVHPEKWIVSTRQEDKSTGRAQVRL